MAEREVSACETSIAAMSQVCGDTWLFDPCVGGEFRFVIAENQHRPEASVPEQELHTGKLSLGEEHAPRAVRGANRLGFRESAA
jgi:hypothetical protein